MAGIAGPYRLGSRAEGAERREEPADMIFVGEEGDRQGAGPTNRATISGAGRSPRRLRDLYVLSENCGQEERLGKSSNCCPSPNRSPSEATLPVAGVAERAHVPRLHQAHATRNAALTTRPARRAEVNTEPRALRTSDPPRPTSCLGQLDQFGLRRRARRAQRVRRDNQRGERRARSRQSHRGPAGSPPSS